VGLACVATLPDMLERKWASHEEYVRGMLHYEQAREGMMTASRTLKLFHLVLRYQYVKSRMCGSVLLQCVVAVCCCSVLLQCQVTICEKPNVWEETCAYKKRPIQETPTNTKRDLLI